MPLFFLYHCWAQGGTLQPAHCCLILFMQAGAQAEVYHDNNLICGNLKLFLKHKIAPEFIFHFYECLYPVPLFFLWATKQPLSGVDGHVESRTGIKKLAIYWLAYFTGFVWTPTMLSTKAAAGFSRATNRCDSKCVSSSSGITLCVHFLHPEPISQKCGYEHSFTQHICFSSDSTWSAQGVPNFVMTRTPGINMIVVGSTWIFTLKVPQNCTYFHFMLLHTSAPCHLRGKYSFFLLYKQL